MVYIVLYFSMYNVVDLYIVLCGFIYCILDCRFYLGYIIGLLLCYSMYCGILVFIYFFGFNLIVLQYVLYYVIYCIIYIVYYGVCVNGSGVFVELEFKLKLNMYYSWYIMLVLQYYV